ncbi:TetR/AcrR family transcriptional regulator [Intrasporangium sp. YIM S08009]|uniref:TetR/AcrR family transcriptional regulator n=1 Tax=Intrasporangium zincisolvens TaxID=3080018 RepID=UPI002B06271F|nr:TetR/AcrR family transcriptional regulator [Intrasporangium sp. YIM S08009]
MDDDVIWLRPEQSAVGRPARHTRAAITDAAVRIGDEHGLAAVTMRSVASALGTAAGSLYRHVTGRDELVDLMVDHVAGEYDLQPSTGAWLDDLAQLAEQGLAIHRRHPWLGDIVTTPVPGPHGLALTERWLASLADHPAPDSDKLVAFAVTNALLGAFARTGYGTDAARARTQAAYLGRVAARGGYPRLAALRPEGPTDPEQVFPEVLRRTLRGLLDS